MEKNIEDITTTVREKSGSLKTVVVDRITSSPTLLEFKGVVTSISPFWED